MATAQEKMETASSRLAEHQERLKQIGAVYKFVLDGVGGGTWIADFKGTPKIQSGDGDAECTIIMSAQDYVDMLEGKANPQQLFFMGKLKVEGDMGLAMKLGDIADIMK